MDKKKRQKKRKRIQKHKEARLSIHDKHFFALKGKNAESVLYELAKDTFLTDWCYLNPMLDSGKELCDLLIVFDDTAIIWQLKDVKLKDGKIRESDIEKNHKQLAGAMRQLAELKNQIKLVNPRRGEEAFDPATIEKIFLISAFFGDEPFILSFSHKTKSGHPIHVFTREFTGIVLNELDTISDFIHYLDTSEKFSQSKTGLIITGGQQDLLGSYLLNNRSFSNYEKYDFALLEGDIWDGLKNRPEYQKKIEEDKVSYCWDSIIDKCHTGDHPEYEIVAREMARPNRFLRRILSKSFLDAHLIAHNGNKPFRRYMTLDGVVYCFLFQDDPEPRTNRINHLLDICHVMRGRHKDKKIIGIATEQKFESTCSYDNCLMLVGEWTEDDQDLLNDILKNGDILHSPEMKFLDEDEYPQT